MVRSWKGITVSNGGLTQDLTRTLRATITDVEASYAVIAGGLQIEGAIRDVASFKAEYEPSRANRTRWLQAINAWVVADQAVEDIT